MRRFGSGLLQPGATPPNDTTGTEPSRSERILLAIHRGETDYEVEQSAMLQFTDAYGIPFERAPYGVAERRSGLYWDQTSLVLLHGGVRRLVMDSVLIPELLRRGATYVEADALDVARIPKGAPLVTLSDLPANLGTR